MFLVFVSKSIYGGATSTISGALHDASLPSPMKESTYLGGFVKVGGMMSPVSESSALIAAFARLCVKTSCKQ